MQHNSTIWRRLPVIAAALMLLFSFRAFGHPITVEPSDTLKISAAIGLTNEEGIVVYDNDSTVGPPNTTINVSVLGNSEIALESDSIVEFEGRTVVLIRFAPTSSATAFATVEIVGDSNTAVVTVVGTPLSHAPAEVSIPNYTIIGGIMDCQNFSISNPNIDSIWITSVEVLDSTMPSDAQWTLENLNAFPMAIVPYTSDTIGQLCAYIAAWDSTQVSGVLRVVYSYGAGTDSEMIWLSANVEHPQPKDSSCVASSGGSFGMVTEGTRVTQWVTFTNTTTSTIVLDSDQFTGTDASDFAIDSGSFPVTLPAKSQTRARLAFTMPGAPTKGNYSAAFDLQVEGVSPDSVPCTALSVSLSASWLLPIVDSLTLDVPPGTNSLSIQAHTLGSRHAIFIQNDTTVGYSLLSLTEDDSSDDAYFGTPGVRAINNLNDTLTPGNTVGPYILTLIEPDTGTYDLNFTITYEVSGTSMKHQIASVPTFQYHVVAHVLPPVTESVSEPTQASVSFALMPNPAEGNVTIMLPDGPASTIEIYDVLGNLIWHGEGSGELSWNGEGAIASGAYIVRVTSKSTDGSIATSSKQLIFEH